MLNGLFNPANLRRAAEFVARQQGIEPTDLSSVPDPAGRVDYLASKLVEQGVQGLTPAAQMTYHAARPLIDGLLAKAFSERLNVPPEVVEFVRSQMQKGAAI